MEKVLLFFSGGNDSTLSALRLVKEGYDVELITFDNGFELGIENVCYRVDILKRLLGDKIHNLGMFSSLAAYRSMRHELVNLNFKEIVKEFGDLNQNQLNCIYCRCAMYAVGILVAKELGIKYIAEGARISQSFAIEQPVIIECFKNLLAKYDMNLLLPCLDFKDDCGWNMDNELLQYQFYTTKLNYGNGYAYEAKCILGDSMSKELTSEELAGYAKYFNYYMMPRIIKYVDCNVTSEVKKQLKNPTYKRIEFN